MAHLLADRFKRSFDEEAVFLDVLSIDLGADYANRIKNKLASARALIAVIGRNWLEADADGVPRLFNKDDFVRLELVTALENPNIHVFPVLEHRDAFPKALPPDLEKLRGLQHAVLRPESIEQDIRTLVDGVKMRLNNRSGKTVVGEGVIDGPSVPPGGRETPAELVARGRFAVSLCPPQYRETHWLRASEDFRDMPEAPLMVLLPPGQFDMGSSRGDASASERPLRRVLIQHPFAIGRFPVSAGEWREFICDNPAFRDMPRTFADDDLRRPITDVSWDDAKAYTDWLARRTALPYRLPSEAEWEYAARAGATGFDVSAAVDLASRFRPNRWGVCGMLGTVDQWVEDDWHDSYQGAPLHGGPWISESAGRKVKRGGSWRDPAQATHSSARTRLAPSERVGSVGFRVARSLLV